MTTEEIFQRLYVLIADYASYTHRGAREAKDLPDQLRDRLNNQPEQKN